MRTKYVGTVDLMGETDAYKKIGQRIRDARMSHPNRYTQKELGDVLGYNQSNMSKMERGERRISLPDLKKLADFLGKPLSYFIDDIDGLRLDPKFALVMTNLDFTVVPVYAKV